MLLEIDRGYMDTFFFAQVGDCDGALILLAIVVGLPIAAVVNRDCEAAVNKLVDEFSIKNNRSGSRGFGVWGDRKNTPPNSSHLPETRIPASS